MSQLIGEEYLKILLPYKDLHTGNKENINIGGILDHILDDTITRLMKNPFLSIMGKSFAEREVFALDTYYIHNVRVLRGFVAKIVEEKKKLADPEANDMVSLLLREESYDDVEQIIDDMIVLFLAG